VSVTQAITERPVDPDPKSLGPWINKELLPLLRQLRAEVNGISIPSSLPPSGPAGGQLGGTYPNPDVRGVRETGGPTLLTMGAVADGEFLKRDGSTVVGDTPTAGSASVEGSIFSTTGPGGAAAPLVVYDFTRYDAALTDVQNLTNAVLLGPALTIQGAAKIDYLSRSNNTGQTPFAFTPMACSVDGGALFTGQQTDYVITSGAPAAVRQLGALTVEYLGYITEPPSGVGDMFLYNCDDAVTNNLYELAWINSADVWRYKHQSGAKTDRLRDLFVTPDTQHTDLLYVPALFALTRAATTGVVSLYINGRLVATPDVASGAVLPDGGASSNLSIGFGQANSKHATLGFRLFDVALTAAQVRLSYQRTFFGVSV
jgi:hypothetical protein